MMGIGAYDVGTRAFAADPLESGSPRPASRTEQSACDGSLHISGAPCWRRMVIRYPAGGYGLPWPEHVEPTPYETSGD